MIEWEFWLTIVQYIISFIIIILATDYSVEQIREKSDETIDDPWMLLEQQFRRFTKPFMSKSLDYYLSNVIDPPNVVSFVISLILSILILLLYMILFFLLLPLNVARFIFDLDNDSRLRIIVMAFAIDLIIQGIKEYTL